jgi:hypothetical protein
MKNFFITNHFPYTVNFKTAQTFQSSSLQSANEAFSPVALQAAGSIPHLLTALRMIS